MNELNDIIKACQKGKSSAQKKIYDLFSAKMFAVCMRYSQDRTEAEDCLQEGFIKVFSHIDKFRFNGSFEGWVRRIMVNTVIAVYRKKKPELLVDDFPLLSEDNEEDTYDPIFNENELLEMIHELPPKYKMVFNLYVIEGYSHSEIAESSGISVGTSKSNLARARKVLKKCVEQKMIEKKQAVC